MIEMRFNRLRWSRDSDCFVAYFDVDMDDGRGFIKNRSEAAEGEIDRFLAGECSDATRVELVKGRDAILARERSNPIPVKSEMTGGDGEGECT